MHVVCANCYKKTDFDPVQWRCDCGGAWEPAELPKFDPEKINKSDYSIWRYGALLGLDIHSEVVPFGIGWTPLVQIEISGRKVHLKLEYLSPSGSFKDRGVNVMVNQLYQLGLRKLIEDSSGNAGASLAMHGARFGIETKIFVPESASSNKINQIKVYGSKVITIPGPRKAAEQAAHAAVTTERIYASHAYNPAYLAGQISGAYELWEQLGQKTPDWIICPVGQGGLFLGYWFGFSNLMRSNLIDHMPRLVAVQSKAISPVYNAWKEKLDHIPEVIPEENLADGAAITKPVRGKRLLQAIQETNGLAHFVSDDSIREAQQLLAHKGFYIEPTSALAVAGFLHIINNLKNEDIVILPLTGSGLKRVTSKSQ